MGRSKLSVTISEQTYKDIKSFAAIKKMKISHLVEEALEEKTRKLKEEELLHQIKVWAVQRRWTCWKTACRDHPK
jgi:ribosomal protein L5